MGKEKFTAETLMNHCNNSNCNYYERGYCHLQEIIIDEDGKCLYNAPKRSSENGGK